MFTIIDCFYAYACYGECKELTKWERSEKKTSLFVYEYLLMTNDRVALCGGDWLSSCRQTWVDRFLQLKFSHLECNGDID